MSRTLYQPFPRLGSPLPALRQADIDAVEPGRRSRAEMGHVARDVVGGCESRQTRAPTNQHVTSAENPALSGRECRARRLWAAMVYANGTGVTTLPYRRSLRSR